jgi:hypothetical protein
MCRGDRQAIATQPKSGIGGDIYFSFGHGKLRTKRPDCISRFFCGKARSANYRAEVLSLSRNQVTADKNVSISPSLIISS